MTNVKYIEIQGKLGEVYDNAIDILKYIENTESSRPLTGKEKTLKSYLCAMRSAAADAMQMMDQE